MAIELLATASKLIELYYVPIVLGLLAIASLTLKRRMALFGAMFLVVILLLVLKPYYAQERPCTQSGIAGVDGSTFSCPTDFGMPSGHAASATLFALASLGTGWFFLFAPLAALISFTRIYAGVHTLPQIAAGIALGIFAWAFALTFTHAFARTTAGSRIIKVIHEEELWLRKILGVD